MLKISQNKIINKYCIVTIASVAIVLLLQTPSDAALLSAAETLILNVAEEGSEMSNLISDIFNFIRIFVIFSIVGAAIAALVQGMRGNDWSSIVSALVMAGAFLLLIEVVTNFVAT